MSEQAMLHEAIRTASDPVKVLRRIVEGCLTLIPEAKGSSLEVRVDADTLEYASCAGNLSDFVGLRLDINHSMSGLSVELIDADSLEDAVEKSMAVAHAGDVVLLSPACASFDMFRNYVHRAEVFVASVMALQRAQEVSL